VGINHAEAVGGLAWHHRDPFDRLLVVQTKIEAAAILSDHEAIRAYDVPLVW